MSDHKPLSADFIVDVSISVALVQLCVDSLCIQVDVYDKNHTLAVAKTLYRQLEDIESQANLKVKVEPSGVSLGRVS